MPEIPANVFGITDVGRVRDHNEDAYHVSANGKLLVVADGMGGANAGEVAAALAIEVIVEQLTPARLELAAEKEETGTLLVDAIYAADQRIFDAARGEEGLSGMGCTLAVGYVQNHRLVICHVGDVRCYVLRDGVLEQSTRDHSIVAAMVQAGEITPDEARFHAEKNVILQAVGRPGVSPDVNQIDLTPGNRILLCSDGLWEALSEHDLQSVLASNAPMREVATQLVGRANHAGGPDNITAVVFEVQPLPEVPVVEAVAEAFEPGAETPA